MLCETCLFTVIRDCRSELIPTPLLVGLSCSRVGRPTLLLGPLGTVLRTALLAVRNASAVEGAAHGVVAHTRQVLHASAANQHHRVLLKVVAFTTDVADDLEAVREPDLRDFTKCGVRLLRRRGVHASAHTPLLRARRERRNLRLIVRRGPRLANELTDTGHK